VTDKWDESLNFKDFESISVQAPDGKLTFDVEISTDIVPDTFRNDLFYRLNVLPIEASPLRDRRKDIPLLAAYFIDRLARKAGERIRSADKKSLDCSSHIPGRGNIRELRNAIERSAVVCGTETFSVDGSAPLLAKMRCQQFDMRVDGLLTHIEKTSDPLQFQRSANHEIRSQPVLTQSFQTLIMIAVRSKKEWRQDCNALSRRRSARSQTGGKAND
jgi:DNA-binding NtrC family response regulator